MNKYNCREVDGLLITLEMAYRLHEANQSPTVCEDGKPSYYYFEDLEEN